MTVPHFCATEEVQAMSADNRPMAVLPRPEGLEEPGAVALDLLPRVRYRVRLGSEEQEQDPPTAADAMQPSLCFESGVMIFPEPGSKSAVVVNLSDRIASLRSGSRTAVTAPQQQSAQQGRPRATAWRSERELQSSS